MTTKTKSIILTFILLFTLVFTMSGVVEAAITREIVMSASATYQGNTIKDDTTRPHFTAVPGSKINTMQVTCPIV